MKKSWEGAYADCVGRGADLVSIHSQVEEEFLALHSKDSNKWLGLKHNPIEGGEQSVFQTGHLWKDMTILTTSWFLTQAILGVTDRLSPTPTGVQGSPTTMTTARSA